MAYEDPNAPSADTSRYAQQTISSADQSKIFLVRQHHPWRRLFARMVDSTTGAIVMFMLLMFALSTTMPEQAVGIIKAIENPIIASIVAGLVWVPAEALLLSSFGTTPAKWLFGIRVVHADGSVLSFSESLNRSMLVFVQGLGLGVPFVVLFTQLFAYRRLTETGTTLWDTSSSAVVFHKEWGEFRALMCTAAVFSVLILYAALNAAGQR